MNIGFWMCAVLAPCFALPGILFAVRKEKAAKWIAGFNSLPEKEQPLYDKARLVKDTRDSCFVWAAVMAAGALTSLASPYCAAAAFIIWSILFFKDVRWDARKALEKYLIR